MSLIRNSQHRRASIATCPGGVEFFPLAPRYEDIWVDDLARSLATSVRYNGHVLDFYSIAQHSVLVSEFLEQIAPEGVVEPTLDILRWGLLHDAAESYVSDICAPIKPFMVGYKAIETQLMFAMARRFDLSWPMPDMVEFADKAVFHSEKTCGNIVMNPDWWELPDEHPQAGLDIKPWDWRFAEVRFLERFVQLFGKDEYARLRRPE